jgi:hypothetical protein
MQVRIYLINMKIWLKLPIYTRTVQSHNVDFNCEVYHSRKMTGRQVSI